MMCSFDATGVPCTRLRSSTISRGSISITITFFTHSSSFNVMLPVPGPISSTVSVPFSFDASRIRVTMLLFTRKC